jgi:hypothetical protein
LDEWQATRGGGLSTGLLVLLANLFLITDSVFTGVLFVMSVIERLAGLP